jgi:hypothetical protein
MAVVGQYPGIDRVGLGEPSLGTGEVTDLPWVDHGDWNARMVKVGDELSLIATGGFKHDVSLRRE